MISNTNVWPMHIIVRFIDFKVHIKFTSSCKQKSRYSVWCDSFNIMCFLSFLKCLWHELCLFFLCLSYYFLDCIAKIILNSNTQTLAVKLVQINCLCISEPKWPCSRHLNWLTFRYFGVINRWVSQLFATALMFNTAL